MNKPVFAYDQIELDASKIDEYEHPVFGATTIFRDVVLAREIVHKYEDGMAYKPADELEASYWTAEGMWAIAGGHPDTAIIMSRDQMQGKTVNVRFSKSLKDPKTKRPNNRGILGDLEVYNSRVPAETLGAMKSGKKHDVSIGFFFTQDATPGKIEEDGHPLKGSAYDYVQRKITINHTAFGLDAGRCPMPFCGVGADEIRRQITGDPFGKWQNMSECIKDIMEENPSYTKEQAAATCAMIEKKSKAKKDAYIMALEGMKTEIEKALKQLNDIDMDGMKLEADLSLEEINSKIDELKGKRITVRKKIDAIYEERMKKEKKPIERPEDKLYDELRDIEEEIQVYLNAKVLKVAGSDAGTPKTEAQRAMAHFKISPEDWEKLSDEEKQKHIDKLPPKGEGLKEGKGKDIGDKMSLEKVKEWFGNLSDEAWANLDETQRQVLISLYEGKNPKVLQNADEDCPDCKDDYDEFIAPHVAKDAQLSYAQKRALPDEVYAYIEPGCEKEDGKTAQRCRHMPLPDEEHVGAALRALKGARTGKVPSYASKAKPKVCAAAKKFKIESEVCGTEDSKFDFEHVDKVLEEVAPARVLKIEKEDKVLIPVVVP